MDKRILGKTNLSISIITFGGILVENYDASKAAELAAFAVDNGVNYVDSAPSYGNSQYVLGPALQPYRKKLFIASKTGERDKEGSKKELLESLKALKTDYFDLYQFHGVSDKDEIEQIFGSNGAMETFHWALKEGLVRNIGFTSHFNAVAMEMLTHDEMKSMLFPVNFALREIKGLSKDPIIKCKEKDVGVVAINSLLDRKWRKGEEETYHCWYKPIYDDPRLAKAALNYTLTREGVTTAVPPGDERMFRLAVKIISSQEGSPKEISGDDFVYLMHHANRLGIDDFLF